MKMKAYLRGGPLDGIQYSVGDAVPSVGAILELPLPTPMLAIPGASTGLVVAYRVTETAPVVLMDWAA